MIRNHLEGQRFRSLEGFVNTLAGISGISRSPEGDPLAIPFVDPSKCIFGNLLRFGRTFEMQHNPFDIAQGTLPLEIPLCFRTLICINVINDPSTAAFIVESDWLS